MAHPSPIPKVLLINAIRSAYGAAATRIVAILRDLDPGSYTAQAGASAIGLVRAVVSDLDSRARGWAERAVKSAYAESRAIATTRLEVIGAERTRRKRGETAADYKARLDRPHRKAIAAYVRATTADFLRANRTILTTAGKYIAAVSYAARKLDRASAWMQAFTSAEVRQMIDKQVIRSVSKHMPRKGVDRAVLDRLLSVLGGGDFININGRNYNLKSYSELVARTRMRQTQTEAVIKTSKEYGSDLVEIPFHASPCDVCSGHVGQVYSLSGESKAYPILPDGGPPWHPNCLCYIRPVTEYSLSQRRAA